MQHLPVIYMEIITAVLCVVFVHTGCGERSRDGWKQTAGDMLEWPPPLQQARCQTPRRTALCEELGAARQRRLLADESVTKQHEITCSQWITHKATYGRPLCIWKAVFISRSDWLAVGRSGVSRKGYSQTKQTKNDKIVIKRSENTS